MRTITLAITNFNRFNLLIDSFRNILDDERVSEIIISDDASEIGLFNDIVDYFKTESKVKIHRNITNQGVYRNKFHSVIHSKNEWVIIFDSDNVINKDYIDKLYEIEKWDSEYVYCPDFAKPKFDYRHFANKVITRYNAAEFFPKKQFDCLINTMNCFANRKEFLKVFDDKIEPSAADSAYFNYRWLMAGNSMLVVPGLQYDHLVHPGSHYVQNIAASNTFHTKMMNAFKNMS